jgi:hypothetical protein
MMKSAENRLSGDLAMPLDRSVTLVCSPELIPIWKLEFRLSITPEDSRLRVPLGWRGGALKPDYHLELPERGTGLGVGADLSPALSPAS